MSTPPPALKQFTGYLLRLAYVKAVGAADDCFPEDTHVREAAILSILAERGAMSQRTLGEVTHVNRSLIVKLVDGLETKGWVVRDRNPDDRRSYALRITPAGESASARLNQDLDKAEAELTANLSGPEVERLKRRLRGLLVDNPSLAVTSLVDRTGYLITHAHHQLRGWAEIGLEPAWAASARLRRTDDGRPRTAVLAGPSGRRVGSHVTRCAGVHRRSRVQGLRLPVPQSRGPAPAQPHPDRARAELSGARPRGRRDRPRPYGCAARRTG